MDHIKNYKLTKIFRMPSDGVLNEKLLNEFIQANINITQVKYKPLDRAYNNDYEIFHLPKKEYWKPDNRITVNFAKYITDTFNSFFIGNPIKVNCEDKAVRETIEFIDSYNNQDDNNAELSKTMSIFGRAYEMYYIDAAGEIGIVNTTPMESFMIYDDSVLTRKKYFVRYYLDANGNLRGSFSDNRNVTYFRYKSGCRGQMYIYKRKKAHGFDDVPAAEYIENAERMGIFESVMSLIDAYNKALSEKANDVDAFADAYMKIIGPGVETKDMVNIRSNRIINFETDGEIPADVDFLARPSADTTQENLLNRLYKDIFIISMVANVSDENFATSSGIALKYKMSAMNNLFGFKRRKFTAGLNQRYKIIFSNPVVRVPKDAWLLPKFVFTPNYPANIVDEAETAAKLAGITSKETQLSVLSIVDDPNAELERIEAEQDLMGNDTDGFNINRTIDTKSGE